MFANLQANEKWVALALLGVAVVVLWVRWNGARLARTGSDAGG